MFSTSANTLGDHGSNGKDGIRSEEKKENVVVSGTVKKSLEDESLLTKSDRLNFTVSMMFVLDDISKVKAQEILKTAGEEIKANIGADSLVSDFWGTSSRNENESTNHILFVNVSGENAQKAADIVYRHMTSSGFSPKYINSNAENPISVHMTSLNRGNSALMKKNKKIVVGIAAGIGAVAAAIIVPFAVPAIVGAMGFGAGGIAAGSFAATLMSLGGGVTPAAVAVMQSIGATGAISAAATTAAATVTGAVAATTAAAVVDKNNEEEEDTDSEEEAEKEKNK